MNRLGQERPNGMSAVVPALNALLADAFALFLKTKNYHWHISGPSFRDYHLLLDNQAAQIFAITDAIAERVRKVGGLTLTSIGDIGRHQRISDDDMRDVSARRMLVNLREDNRVFVEALHDLKRIAEEAGDNATSGVLDGWTDEAEQRLWFLSEVTAGVEA